MDWQRRREQRASSHQRQACRRLVVPPPPARPQRGRHHSCCARPPRRRRHPSPRWAVLPISAVAYLAAGQHHNAAQATQGTSQRPSIGCRCRPCPSEIGGSAAAARDETAGQTPGCCCRRPSPAGRVARQSESRALGGRRQQAPEARADADRRVARRLPIWMRFYILNMDKRQAPTRTATRTGRAMTAATQLVLPQSYRAV